MHSTINELESNLQRTRELQEEEEKNKRDVILKLTETIEDLKKNVKDADGRAKVCIFDDKVIFLLSFIQISDMQDL